MGSSRVNNSRYVKKRERGALQKRCKRTSRRRLEDGRTEVRNNEVSLLLVIYPDQPRPLAGACMLLLFVTAKKRETEHAVNPFFFLYSLNVFFFAKYGFTVNG